MAHPRRPSWMPFDDPAAADACGWMRYGIAASTFAAITATAWVTLAWVLPAAARALLPGAWRRCLQDLLPAPSLAACLLMQVALLTYWCCLVARRAPRGAKNAAVGLPLPLALLSSPPPWEISAHLAVVLALFKLACIHSASDAHATSAAIAHWILWIGARAQFGRSTPPFPPVEGRSRFFRVKAALGFALADALRTAGIAAVLCAGTSALVGLARSVLPATLAGAGDSPATPIFGATHPTAFVASWLTHVAAHVAEIVATERFHFVRILPGSRGVASAYGAGGGGEGPLVGMTALLEAMRPPKGAPPALSRELAFLDACLLSEKSRPWRQALFTEEKGGHWHALMAALHGALDALQRALADAIDGRKEADAIARVACALRTHQHVCSWALRTLHALAR